MRNVVISFNDVKLYIKTHCNHSIDEIVDATEPFVMDYIKHPFGFAETNDENDIDSLINTINQSFSEFTYEPDGRVRRGLISRTIKIEKTRWEEGRNAWFYGRFIGRVAYLMNKEVEKMIKNNLEESK